MKANELRIGNYYNQFGNIEKVSWVTLKNLGEDLNDKLWCKPIPLTQEWLLKFGFEWKGNKFLTIFTPCGKAFVYLEDNFFKFVNVTIEIPIKYVHQLQNLYFTLTGEELELINK